MDGTGKMVVIDLAVGPVASRNIEAHQALYPLVRVPCYRIRRPASRRQAHGLLIFDHIHLAMPLVDQSRANVLSLWMGTIGFHNRRVHSLMGGQVPLEPR